MKTFIKEENEYYVVYSCKEYQSRIVNVPLLKTKRKSEAGLMIKYLNI